MYALVENNQFVKLVNSNKGITIGDNQYPQSIFTLWTNEEREAIGIYKVSIDNTNKKDETFYVNTDMTYDYSNGTVTGSYGTATEKNLNDLKTKEISKIKQQAKQLLNNTDWYVIRYQEDNTQTIPTNIATYRNQVRVKSNEMENQINACGTVEDLKNLYEVTEDDEGNLSRALASFPSEVE